MTLDKRYSKCFVPVFDEGYEARAFAYIDSIEALGADLGWLKAGRPTETVPKQVWTERRRKEFLTCAGPGGPEPLLQGLTWKPATANQCGALQASDKAGHGLNHTWWFCCPGKACLEHDHGANPVAHEVAPAKVYVPIPTPQPPPPEPELEE